MKSSCSINKQALPVTGRDVMKLSFRDKLIYDGLIKFFRATGLWRYPIEASGDLETMTLLDKIYWAYKLTDPIKNAKKHSGLENYFKEQESFSWKLPKGFRPIKELKLSAVGDLMNNPYLENSKDSLYKEVFDTIFGADISMANLECVIYPKSTEKFSIALETGPKFQYNRESFETVKGFKDKNYSFMATASNHSLDFGEPGITSTIQTLKKEGIAFNGMNESEKTAHAATIIEKKGFKIGVVSHTFGVNAYPIPPDKPWIINRSQLNGKLEQIDLSLIEKQIRFCRENKVDIAIMQLHWGFEHEFYPRPSQVELSHHFAEMGFDVIIGHHPHVVQPVEFYRTKRDPARIVPIYYSLGNLVNPFTASFLCLSYVAKVTLSKGISEDGLTRTFVKDAGKIEIVQEADNGAGKIRLTKV